MRRWSLKVVILAGGLGTRMREETEFRPKPMVEVGGKPVLWHIMKIFATQGATDFVILTGYKGEMIKRFFYDYSMLNLDFKVTLGDAASIEYYGAPEEDGWTVTVVDTGQLSLTGQRILGAQKYLNGEPFFLTYGDGVANVNLAELKKSHASSGATLTVTTARPQSRFGVIAMKNESLVDHFVEKPAGKELINIGYMMASPQIFDFLEPDGSLEDGPLARMAQEGVLGAHFHQGFWQPMDTIREAQSLNKLWDAGDPPWLRVPG